MNDALLKFFAFYLHIYDYDRAVSACVWHYYVDFVCMMYQIIGIFCVVGTDDHYIF